jgi:hypothetical protein
MSVPVHFKPTTFNSYIHIIITLFILSLERILVALTLLLYIAQIVLLSVPDTAQIIYSFFYVGEWK